MNDEKDTKIVIESDPFSMIPNDLVRNTSVSNDAVRIYLIIKSYIGIPDFILYRNTVKKSFPGGEYSFKKGWKELKDLGYLVQIKEHINGRYTYSYKLLSTPIQQVNKQSVEKQEIDNQSSEFQSVEIQGVENQPVENRPSINRNNFNNNDSNNNELNNLVVDDKAESDAVVEKRSNHGNIFSSNKKSFDESRFLNSKDVTVQILRISEAQYFDEKAKESISRAVKFLADSCNCFSLESIKVINTFTDIEYGELFNIAYDLANDQLRFNDIDNPKKFMSSEIKKRIANHMVN